MGQRILVIKIGRGKILSKPWSFEAMCLVDDNRCGSIAKSTMEAIRYLFEGTNATDEVIDHLSDTQNAQLCSRVWSWFLQDIRLLMEMPKPQQNGKGKEGKGKLRDIYTAMFEAWGKLPDEVGRQSPKCIFNLLSGVNKKTEVSVPDLPPDIQQLYGI